MVDAACAELPLHRKAVSLKPEKEVVRQPGLGGEPDPDRFILFIPVNTRLKSSNMSILFIAQQHRDLIDLDFGEDRNYCINIFLHTDIGCRQ